MEDQNKEVQEQSSEEKDSNKTMLMIIGAVGVIIIVIGGFFLMRSRPESESISDTAMEEETMMEEDTLMPANDSSGDEMMVEDEDAMMEEGETREITVSGFSFGYTPETLTMKAGEKIKLTFVSEDMLHDFVIEGTEIATEQIKGGTETTIEFTAPEEPGEYTFYCSVGNHRAQGMEGTLTVE